MVFILAALIAYALGSISSAVIVSKMLGLPDPREQGSGNPGATNVLRTGSRKAAIMVLIADILKGFLAIMIARLFHVGGIYLGIVGLLAILGHVFPVFFKFKGGKGVATTFGVLLGLSLMSSILLIIVWMLVVFFIRYVSVASITAAILAPLFLLFTGNGIYSFPILLAAVVIVWKHFPNIERLKEGTENKFRF